MEGWGGLAQILDFRQPPLKLSGGFHLIWEPVHPILRKPDTRSQETKYKHNSGGRTKIKPASKVLTVLFFPFGFKKEIWLIGYISLSFYCKVFSSISTSD